MKENKKEERKRFHELEKGDIFIFVQRESFGTVKVKNVIQDFDKSKKFLIVLPDKEGENIITKEDGFIYNAFVRIESKYQKRPKHKHKNNKQHGKNIG